MKRLLKITFLLLIASLFYLNIGCNSKQKSEPITLTISAAASLKNSMNEVKQLYEAKNSDVKLTFNFGSSGTLQQQIEQGADVDIFISAATKQMDALESKDLIFKDTRKDLLQNDVVLIVPKDNSAIKGFNDLITDKAKKIALGEPKTVPAGQYAEEIFTKLGIIDKIKSKAVYAKDVTEVLTWVKTGNADAGIVYSTDAKTTDKIKVIAAAPSDSHKPVIYPTAIVKSSKKIDSAKNFINFLTDAKAKAVFEKYGFKINTK
jgi:molybdate transport system substrate-binding protein